MKSKQLLITLTLVLSANVALARLPGGMEIRNRTFRMREAQVKTKKALIAQKKVATAILEETYISK